MAKWPDKLETIPHLARADLPDWITDFGMAPAGDGRERPSVVAMTRAADGTILLRCAVDGDMADEPEFWEVCGKYMIANLGGCLFEREHPGIWGRTIFWEAQAAASGRPLSEEQRGLIARRRELTWNPA